MKDLLIAGPLSDDNQVAAFFNGGSGVGSYGNVTDPANSG